jgi:alkanesulfonate monooxygenase SsuD/methylene tetrahydromethanopterin reductase-like flavin-dependent oxidoreductase (luciferase family)
VTVDEYAAKCRVLEEHCRAVGRDPATIRRSLMIPIITGRTAAEVDTRRARARAIFPRMPEDAAGWHTAGFLHGSVDEVRRDLQRWAHAGISRAMLQILDMTDLEMIRLIGEELAS